MNEMKKQEHPSNEERTPFFSIIMPVYNAAPFLRECIECILAQDFHDWEVIMVDDKSSDDSAEIAEEYCRENPKIRLFMSSSNSGGAYSPRMRAASLASGKYLVTVDADDLISADYLSRLHETISSCVADLAITEMWILTEDKCEKKLPLESIDKYRTWIGKDLISHTLVRWGISMNGFAIRREIYLEADRYISSEERKSIFADELLSRWILYLSGNVAICTARYYYRQNAGSVTHINVRRTIESRMLTADSLILMTETTFGKESYTYLRAVENKLYSIVDMLRLINASKLDAKDTSLCERSIRNAMKESDLYDLKGKTSPRYLALMRLPIRLARIALKFLDPFIRMKDGI